MGIPYLRVKPTYLLAAFGTFTWFFIFYQKKKKKAIIHLPNICLYLNQRPHWEPKEDWDTMSAQAQDNKDMEMTSIGSEEVLDKTFEALFQRRLKQRLWESCKESYLSACF